MIVRSRGANRELRWMSDHATNPPRYMQTMLSSSGSYVTPDAAIGLPAVMACIRDISETIASLGIDAYRGRKADKRVAEDAWQHGLLHDMPFGDEMSPFDWISDMVSSIEASGNFFAQKIRGTIRRNQLVALRPLHPAYAYAYRDRDSGEKLFKVYDGQHWNVHTRSEILHIRGITVGTDVMGLSPITVHREKLGWALAIDKSQGHFFANDATPPGAIVVPGRVDEAGAQRIQDAWEAKHGGPENRGRPAILHSGATWAQIGISAEDAQFVETEKMSVEQICRMFLWPNLFAETDRTDEQERLRLLKFVEPRLGRIEEGLRVDPDIFPDRDPYPELNRAKLVRSDAKTQAEVRHLGIQDGSLLVDEARADEGRPPLHEVNPDLPENIGLTPQIVPVGGSPFGIPAPEGEEGDSEAE